jgi:hypothetical protein
VLDTGRRLWRVATGLLRPSTRAAYLDALRRRITAGGRPSAIDPCAICGSETLAETIEHSDSRPERPIRFPVRICTVCGFLANPENTSDYRRYESIEKLPMRVRIGTEERQGREYHMARMGAAILGRRGLDVLIYGAGRSLDNHHIAALPAVRSVVIGDIMRIREDAEFIDITHAARRRFTLVVASEVIEHFLEPRRDFRQLFSFVERGGLLVCSSTLYDGSDLAHQTYPYIRGHTSFFTPRSLGVIARDHGLFVDFRVPKVATGYAGRRKRYVLFTSSSRVIAATAEYFGRHIYAPSEPPWPPEELETREHRRRLRASRAAVEDSPMQAAPADEAEDDEIVNDDDEAFDDLMTSDEPAEQLVRQQPAAGRQHDPIVGGHVE